jgi:hypothetical protein
MLFEKESPWRYTEFYHDFSTHTLSIKEREIISVYPDKLATNWSLVANMQRRFKASLSKNIGYKYLLTTNEKAIPDELSWKYKRVNSYHARKYLLFKLDDE